MFARKTAAGMIEPKALPLTERTFPQHSFCAYPQNPGLDAVVKDVFNPDEYALQMYLKLAIPPYNHSSLLLCMPRKMFMHSSISATKLDKWSCGLQLNKQYHN